MIFYLKADSPAFKMAVFVDSFLDCPISICELTFAVLFVLIEPTRIRIAIGILHCSFTMKEFINKIASVLPAIYILDSAISVKLVIYEVSRISDTVRNLVRAFTMLFAFDEAPCVVCSAWILDPTTTMK